MSESTGTKVRIKILSAYAKNFKDLERLINENLDKLAQTCLYITNVQCLEHRARLSDDRLEVEFTATLYVTYVVEDVPT